MWIVVRETWGFPRMAETLWATLFAVLISNNLWEIRNVTNSTFEFESRKLSQKMLKYHFRIGWFKPRNLSIYRFETVWIRFFFPIHLSLAMPTTFQTSVDMNNEPPSSRWDIWKNDTFINGNWSIMELLFAEFVSCYVSRRKLIFEWTL